MRLMSNFSYQDARGNIVQVPVRYGDMNRQVAQIMKQNSENTVPSVPFIACYIKNLEFARDRLQDPTYISKVNIRERAFDENGQEYLNTQGANYTVERLMPTPYNVEFVADIWASNTDQKLQLLEQILVLFAPSMEIQSSNNYLDWTSLSLLELKSSVFSSRSVPQGLEQDIDVATLTFTSPIWITTPAKVKKLGIITKIITHMYSDGAGQDEASAYSDSADIDYFSGRKPLFVDITTLGDLGIMILNNTATLVPPQDPKTNGSPDNLGVPSFAGTTVNWVSILDLYPGQFIAGLSQIRLTKPDGNEIVGYISLNPTDESMMVINFAPDSIPMNTLIYNANNLNPRGTIDAIINPQTFNPITRLPSGHTTPPAADTRYLILEDINIVPEFGQIGYSGPVAWKNADNSDFQAYANDIIQWDGTKWNVLFTSQGNDTLTYITNSRTGIQYAWDGASWMKSFEGIYSPGQWRLVL